MNQRVSDWLERAPRPYFVAYAGFAAFAAYFCMYAFRKPFSAAEFEGATFLGTQIELKTALVTGQVVGYTVSKYLGIKWVTEVRRPARMLIGLIVAAQLALLAFAVLPGDARVLAIFLNGLPLGMVWGMVVRYLEGRRTSELLLTILSCSFIVASGAVKDVGRFLMSDLAVSEAWMPFATGALFLLPFFVSVWLLDRLPPPSEHDVRERVERKPMNRAERIAFIRRFWLGLGALFIVYFFLTAYRDFRDAYGVEIFNALGYEDAPTIFTQTELPVAFAVLLVLGTLQLVRGHRRALFGAYTIMVSGALMLGVGTWLFSQGHIGGATWMVLTGVGSYFVYVPYGSILFDRWVAASGVGGTAVFAIYVADALGYTGSVGVQLGRDLLLGDTSRLEFFTGFTWALCIGGVALLLVSGFDVSRRTRPDPG